MPSIQNGKNISIHFTEDEIPLLDEFEQYRKQNYINRSGWVKQHMKKALTENKRQLAFRWNENLSDICCSRRDAQDSFTQIANEGGRGHRRDDSRKIQQEEVTWMKKTPPCRKRRGLKREKSTTFIYKFYTQEDICLLDQTERISAFISQRTNSLC